MEFYRYELCKQCGLAHQHDLEVVTSPEGSQTLVGVCLICGTSRTLPEDTPPEAFIMPYGKYIGWYLKQIPMDYLIWAKDNSKGSVKRKVNQFLSRTNRLSQNHDQRHL